MPDTTIIVDDWATGATLYTVIKSGVGPWNGTAFAALVVANWATYATATPETPSGSRQYICQFPTGAPAGNYSWSVYLQAGASPALGDVRIGGGSGYWDGTTFGGASKLTSFGFSVPVSGTVSLGADGLDAVVVEPAVGDGVAVNGRQALMLAAAAAAAQVSGAGGTQVELTAAGNPAVTRITADVDSVGNRTSVTLNLEDE